MPFIDIARALFAYSPQSTDELPIEENDVLYVLEKGEDDWWKVKKKVDSDDDGPIGLVPRNYLKEIIPISTTRTLYDYTAQTEEELSFSADLSVEIFDKDDPDWYLVRLKGAGRREEDWEYGFVPSNYLDDGEVESAAKLPSVLPEGRPDSLDERRPLTPPPQEEEEPVSPNNAMTTYGRPDQHYSVRDPTSSSKFRTWEVEEIDSRKRRKKGTLGIGNSQILWSCEADKTPVQTWPITSLIEYNTEKKHLFIELSSPPKPASFHFHAESRAIASEISDAIGEIAGATRASGLREVAAASGDPLPPLPETSALAQRHKREDSDDLPIDDGIKRGVMLYDFDAQGDDELDARQDQIVEILDDSDEEWWKCKAGNREGAVPASYVEVIKTRPAPKNQSPKDTVIASAGTSSQQPRKKTSISSSSPTQQQATIKQNLTKPDMSKVRTWTDRSGSFKVEAQFLGLSDDKIQLHKLNGVKISVPLSKMSSEDMRYIEKLAGRKSSPPPPKPPPDSEKPKAKRIEFDWYPFFLESGVDYNVCQRYAAAFERDQMDESVLPDINSETLRTLGVREGDILRIMKRLDDKFGRTSSKKKIVRFGGEEVVENDEKDDLSDVIKITRPSERQESLFSSGPGGALRNNTTRRGRPTTSKSAPGEVDGTLLSTPVEGDPEPERHGVRPLRVPPSRLANFQEQPQKSSGEGFEDDAWAVNEKPPPQPQRQPQPAPVVQSPTALTSPPAGSAIQELASINPPNVNQVLPPPLQPQTSPVTIQFNPQPATPLVVNRPSSVPPTQTAPQLQPLQQHNTGVPPQPHLTGPTPAQVSRVPSLDDQLAKLQLYRQQQQIQQVTYLSQFQPPQPTFANGYSQVQPQPTILQPQPTAYLPNFLPPGQQSSQLGPTRSLSAGLPPPLIPTNPISPQSPTFIATHRTGPANFGPTVQPQFQPATPAFQQSPLQPQQTSFQAPQPQPQPQAFNPQPIGLQAQRTNFQPPSFLPPSPLVPQQTAFQAQMLPQKTGSDATFKPVSFGAKPKPLVPSRTGKRANLSAATPENPFGF